MSEKKHKYITTTLPYVNADPHIGFALELLQADTLARHWRYLGHEVFFSTGTDEHGQKIAQKADEEGKSRQEYTNHFANEFNNLKESLQLSNDAFIRTTSDSHKEAAQEMWRRCDANGDIYKKKYTGLYCVGCELFYKESELDENKCCTIHDHPVEEVEEENYFFKLSNYSEKLIELLSDESRVLPDWQRKWALEFVKGGLEDLSISRHISRMDWGVPVPNDDEQVMYVWFDALTNYISTLGWPNQSGDFQKFWLDGETVQLAGKDQVRFQSIIWQAMLLSANIPTTDVVFYHGFINSGGQKMSKSLGNVISPYELVKKYGTDATRYLLLRHVHPTDDSDVTWEKMDEWYTANLVNGIGNLVARVTKMAESYDAFPAKNPADDWLLENSCVRAPLDAFDFQNALNQVWKKIGDVDQQIQETQPFKLIKEDEKKAVELVQFMVDEVYRIAYELKPFMPATSNLIIEAIRDKKKPENLFARLEK